MPATKILGREIGKGDKPFSANLVREWRDRARHVHQNGNAREIFMTGCKLLLLSGDGIGPEVMGEVKRLLGFLAKTGVAMFETEEALVGGSCYDAHKVSITEETMAKRTPPTRSFSAPWVGRNGTT
jgi:hypothetical protein